MRRQRLLWQIFAPMILITSLSLAAIDWYGITLLRRYVVAQTIADLRIRAQLLREQLGPPLLARDYQALAEMCGVMGTAAGARLTIILAQGRVVCDSDKDARDLDNHADRLEIIDARQHDFGSAIRFSRTLQRELIYVAVPVDRPDGGGQAHNRGVLRLAIPLAALDETLRPIWLSIIISSFLLLIPASFVTYRISRKLTRPLEEMRQSAEAFAEGDFERKIVIDHEKGASVEFAALAASLNKMAVLLDERIWTVTEQRNQLEAVFAGMKEAVFVVDMEEKFINANQAALNLLGFSLPQIEGKSVLEVIRNHELQHFVTATLASTEAVEDEVVLREEPADIYLLAHGKVLRDSDGVKFGALVVLNDVTKIRRLENVRRDFVANVSHELKTPITTIKGFVETLLDDAVADRDNTLRFLGIVLKNANRLSAIVDDLLTLSKIELEDENAVITFSRGPLIVPLRCAVEACFIKARNKGITISLQCPPELMATINAPLLEQAVTNLIVNGIKYSHANSEVLVAATATAREIGIRVTDQGIGIGAEHLPRLFERFYRSDKARSRNLGGTGLGLAIVNHIVQAHKGSVGVESTPGRGSTFTIRLPVSPDLFY